MYIFKPYLLYLKPAFLASYKITRFGAFFDSVRNIGFTSRSR